MKLRQIIGQITPEFLKKKIRAFVKDKKLRQFNSIQKINCVSTNLLVSDNVKLSEIFQSEELESSWNKIRPSIESLDIMEGTGGVNAGDRRAIYYLIKEFAPESVLEVGTHIGASTVHIASALSSNENGSNSALTTLDIRDVNSPVLKPWLNYGMNHSPKEMLEKINCDSLVTFKTGNSTQYLKNTSSKYDFIFLDGDHLSMTTYKEIPAALSLLKPNGIILLHDFFPDMKPLWSNGTVLEDTYRAVERLLRENADLTVLPLGALPWPTKLNSNVTSLALLLRKN